MTADLGRAAAHCPRCLAEYRAGFDTCADDGTSLLPGPAPVTEEHAPEDARRHAAAQDDTPVVLCRLPQVDADLMVAKLRSEGLGAFADQKLRGLWFSDIVPDFALCRVWVLESDLARAGEVARRALAGEDAI